MYNKVNNSTCSYYYCCCITPEVVRVVLLFVVKALVRWATGKKVNLIAYPS